MMRSLGAVVIVAGLLLLIAGMAAPTTDTHRSVTCVDSAYAAADGCVETTVETPNFGKAAMVMSGFVTLVVGGGMAAFGSRSEAASNPPNSLQTGETLVSQIQRQDNGDTSETDR